MGAAAGLGVSVSLIKFLALLSSYACTFLSISF